MFIPDLHEFPAGHPPNPYSFPLDIERDGRMGYLVLPDDTWLRAVGWLGSEVTSRGDTRDECIDRLFHAYESHLLLWEGLHGWHSCEICTGNDNPSATVQWRGRTLPVCGSGHHLVFYRNVVYMCPALILHYILDRHYRPPDEFVEAVVEGSFLTADDLKFVEMEKPRTGDDAQDR